MCNFEALLRELEDLEDLIDQANLDAALTEYLATASSMADELKPGKAASQ